MNNIQEGTTTCTFTVTRHCNTCDCYNTEYKRIYSEYCIGGFLFNFNFVDFSRLYHTNGDIKDIKFAESFNRYINGFGTTTIPFSTSDMSTRDKFIEWMHTTLREDQDKKQLDRRYEIIHHAFGNMYFGNQILYIYSK